jgi:hypothetical protein
MEADGATRIVRGRGFERARLVTAYGRADHHDRGGIETAALDQVANGMVDAGTDAVVVGAQPNAARWWSGFDVRYHVLQFLDANVKSQAPLPLGGIVHSAAVLSLAPASVCA